MYNKALVNYNFTKSARQHSNLVSLRHSAVLQSLGTSLRDLGVYVRYEPQMQGSKRADLEIILHSRAILVDVTIVNTVAKSYTKKTFASLCEMKTKKKRSHYECSELVVSGDNRSVVTRRHGFGQIPRGTIGVLHLPNFAGCAVSKWQHAAAG